MMRKRFGPHGRGMFIGAVLGALLVAAWPVAADVGDPVLQGRINRVDRKTVLAGAAESRSMLRVNNSAPTGSGITIDVAEGRPPLIVNSDRRIRNLNADKVDGLSSRDLLPGRPVLTGTTVRGTYAMGASAGTAGDLAMSEISFGHLFAFAPVAHFIELGEAPPAACPGTVTAPRAAPGHLCVYESDQLNADIRDTNGADNDGSAFAFGARLFVRSEGAGDFYSMGTWAATAAPLGAEPAAEPASASTLGVSR